MKNRKSPKNVVTTYFWRATATHYKSITYRLSFLMRSLLTVQDGSGNGALIFVTVGTTIPFDELLVEVDRLAAIGVIEEDIICQGGQSRYSIANGEQFVGRPGIAELYDAASLVVCHGGAATVLELLRAEKAFVAFPNPRGAGDHQTSFLRQISSIADISWSQDVADLERLIAERRERGSSRIDVDIPKAAAVIRSCLKP